MLNIVSPASSCACRRFYLYFYSRLASDYVNNVGDMITFAADYEMLLQLDQTDDPAVSAAFEEQMTTLPSFKFEVGKVKLLLLIASFHSFMQQTMIAKLAFQ